MNYLKAPDVLRATVQSRVLRRGALVLSIILSLILFIMALLDPRDRFSGSVAVKFDYPHPNLTEPTVYDVSDHISLVEFPGADHNVQYHPFSTKPEVFALADRVVRPIRSHTQLSGACLDQWVGLGRWEGPCTRQTVADSSIDLVYLWVNGSDPLHGESRRKFLSGTDLHPKNARFREHDELRYALRSAANATRTWMYSRWIIITDDVPHPYNATRRLGPVPQWLDLGASGMRPDSVEPPISFFHHSEIFRYMNHTDSSLALQTAVSWRDRVVPTFNSLSIESQLANLDPDSVSENIVYLNDDQFLMLPMSPSTFHSTLYGPVLRFETKLMVGPDASGNEDGSGEWRSLKWSEYLLNKRFGSRRRVYVAHNARSLSLPLMHETSLAFGHYFSSTPLSRFRGSHNDRDEIEVNTIFMAAHYIVERKREALLWSWIVAKWGADYGGVLTEDVKTAMWNELGGQDDSGEISLRYSRRTTSDDVDYQLKLANLKSPRPPDRNVAAHTDYIFVSQDGYDPTLSDQQLPNVISRVHCLGDGPISAWDLFRDVASGNTGCGDAIIHVLVARQAGTGGLAIFLPKGTNKINLSDPIILPLQLPTSPPALPQNLRAFAIRLIHRYSFVVGDTHSRFIGLESYWKGKDILNRTTKQKDIALLCINDDLPDSPGSWQFQRTDQLLKAWFQARWPEPLDREYI